jgi:DNA modification methylase
MKIHHGDALSVLREMPEASVHCCVTSPPYYGLRDYGTAEWDGGDPGCDHQRVGNWPDPKHPCAQSANGHGGKGQRLGSDCIRCGAVRVDRQIGLEPTPELFIANLVEVFREVRRVLRMDGTCWVNIGDSYAGSWGSQGGQGHGAIAGRSAVAARQIAAAAKKSTRSGSIPDGSDLKPKDLIGIPWMLAFALRADGWYLRQDIIWHKPNPMPESVKDRCTKAHEYLFLLTKSARYWWDAVIATQFLIRARKNYKWRWSTQCG